MRVSPTSRDTVRQRLRACSHRGWAGVVGASQHLVEQGSTLDLMLIGLAGEVQARDDVARCLVLLDGFVMEPVEKAWLRVVRPPADLMLCCPDIADPADALWVKARAGFVAWCGEEGVHPLGSVADWPFDWVVRWSVEPGVLVRRVSTMVEALSWRRV